MRSDNPEARIFKDWVTRDVFPAIRKGGGYIKGEEKVGLKLSHTEGDAYLFPPKVTPGLPCGSPRGATGADETLCAAFCG